MFCLVRVCWTCILTLLLIISLGNSGGGIAVVGCWGNVRLCLIKRDESRHLVDVVMPPRCTCESPGREIPDVLSHNVHTEVCWWLDSSCVALEKFHIFSRLVLPKYYTGPLKKLNGNYMSIVNTMIMAEHFIRNNIFQAIYLVRIRML